MAKQDRLYVQGEDEHFQDVTYQNGLGSPTACESAVAGDFDNDMDVDLYLVCHGPIINLPNILFENDNQGAFVMVPEAGGAVGSTNGRGESAVVADYDHDGFLDLFVVNGAWGGFENGPHQLFRNTGNTNHWIEVDLEGVVSNRDGIGARVYASAGGKTQLREQVGGMHNSSQNHQRVHFGLGTNTVLDELVIHWPSGIVQQLNGITADQILHVVEP
jgi:hypothetical protein